MIDKELLIILVISGSVLLYTLGGWKWKWLRREVLPLGLSLSLLIVGYDWWKCLLFAISQDLVFRLPYGDKTPYWLKALVGCTFSLPSLLFGFTIWQAILPIVFIISFGLSNIKKFSKDFTWKICEALAGVLIGIIIARFISTI